jgi:hypothetical protein
VDFLEAFKEVSVLPIAHHSVHPKLYASALYRLGHGKMVILKL